MASLFSSINQSSYDTTIQTNAPPMENVETFFSLKTPTPKETQSDEPIVQTVSYEVPTVNTNFKAYTDYRCITSRSSAQWKIRQQSYTDENGLRKVDDYYCIALGSYYGTSIGDKYRITLDNGNSFLAILADVKMDIHTDPTNRYVESNGNLVEFYVDTKLVDPMILNLGTVSYLEQLRGNVVQVERFLEP